MIYQRDDLTQKYQSFKHCHKAQKIRLAIIIYLTLHILFVTFYMGVDMFRTFTNQTLVLDLVSIGLTFLGSRKKTKLTKNRTFLSAHHLCFTTVVANNCLMLSIYWTLLHPLVMAEYNGDMPRKIHACLVHSLPAVAVLINFKLTDFVVKA